MCLFLLFGRVAFFQLECFQCVRVVNFLFVPFCDLFLLIQIKKSKNTDTAKKKQKMQKKHPNFFQLAQSCSQIIFLIFVWGLKNANLC